MGICIVCGDPTEYERSAYCKQCWMRYHQDYKRRSERGIDPRI